MTQPTYLPFSDIDWDDIIDTLGAEKCVLFLGSSAYSAPEEGAFDEALRNFIKETGAETHPYLSVFHDDGFLQFKAQNRRRHLDKVITDMKSFFQEAASENEERFSKIARIPFSIIMTLLPDNILSQVFDQQGFDYQHGVYVKKRPPAEDFETPSAAKPLIYNMMGNVEEPESLVLTHGHFFDYMESIIQARSMHPKLKELLRKSEHFIFLGLPYEQWYFQLLLRMLSMHLPEFNEIKRLALKRFEDPRLNILYHKEFKIEFVPDRIDHFLDSLYSRCETEGILKSENPGYSFDRDKPFMPYDEIRELTTRNLRAAMDELKHILFAKKPKSIPSLDELITIKNRYTRFKQREGMGVLDSRDAQVEYNNIVKDFVGLLTYCEGDFPL